MKRLNIFNEKGAGLALAIFVVTILAAIILAIVLVSRTHTVLAKREQLSSKAQYAAEAGLNYYLYLLNRQTDYYQTTVNPAQINYVNYEDGGSYFLNVATPSGIAGVEVTSTGRYIYKDSDGKQNIVKKSVKATMEQKSFTKYLYFTDLEETSPGVQVVFNDGDVYNGRIHSNDNINIAPGAGPRFNGPVSTSKTVTPVGGDHAYFAQGYEENVPPLQMPATNTDLRTIAQSGGYYYFGRTEITLNSAGTINIVNNNVASTGPVGTNKALPPNGVIYVDGLTTEGKWNANSGNAFVRGTLNGKLTIASFNNIYIMDHLLYNNSDNDMLGLIADKYIHVNEKDESERNAAIVDIQINAAVFALNNSFTYEGYRGDYKGTLTVNGSIIQNSRGPIGFESEGTKKGYTQNYIYDERLLHEQPPHFLKPLNAGYEISNWQEVNNP